MNSSTLALEKFDFNKSTGHTPSVIGAQEVYKYVKRHGGVGEWGGNRGN